MKILFLTRRAWPKIGGVEKHIFKVTKILKKRGHKVKVVSEADIKYPHIKFLGIIFIWHWLFMNRKIIVNADIIHCHDVFIWYFPFCLIYPKKYVVTTVHGLEWDRPKNLISIFQKRLAATLSDRTVGVGIFLERRLRVTFNKIIYGAADRQTRAFKKDGDTIVYVGRLEKNTGLLEFLKWLAKNKKYTARFCGDGVMRNECAMFGEVYGFTDPVNFYKRSEYCVPGGYLAALEALSYNCRLKLFWDNDVKKSYWKTSPFYKLKGNKLRSWAREQTWEKLADEYLDLYKFSDQPAK